MRKLFLIVIVLVFTGQSIYAQTGTNSPYSRFGIGQLKSKSVNSRLHGMGGLSNAISSNRFVNPSNPASYAGFDSLSFLFNAGLEMNSTTYRTAALTEKGSNASLSYFSLGFPVTHRWKTALGLLPYSDVGYSTIVSGVTDETGRYNYAYSGDGGLNQLFLGNAFKISDRLSVGINLTYVFGRNTSSTLLYFPDSTLYANTKTENRLLANDFMLDYGIIYAHPIGKDYTLNAGLTYGQKIKLSITEESLTRSLFGGVNGGVEYILDTISYTPERKNTITLPHTLGFGLAFERNDQWLVGLDANWQNWKDFKIGNQPDSLQNSWNIAIGGEFTPPYTSISKYWSRVTYRLGARYNQTYLNIYNESINEFGISFGLGLPLPRSLTTIDLSVEIGRGGTTAKNLIQETFVNFTLGVSIYERWFVKRRYN
ncbi:MAG: outer membrane protein transport protein [Bacteroidetes bacterium]|nr:outer membrane protein transport protein [Bacteroidota bacterium]MDA3942265.1 hypothetical protein [Bacteroidota bacterium]